MTPKIVFLSPVSYFKGGAERSLFDLLANPEIEPVLVAPSEGEILEKGRALGLECYVLPFGSIHTIHRPFSFMKGLSAFKSLLTAAHELKHISKQTNAQIVHSNGLKAHAINCTSRWIGGAKSILHIRDIPYTKAEKLVWKILRVLCNKMVMVSHACWPDKTLPRKVVIIHNGTPLLKTEPRELSPSENTLTFGFIGRIHPAKGLDLLINWISDARKAGLEAKLSVRGTYSEDSPSYQAEIDTLIKTLNLGDHIEFTGFIDTPEALYKGIDITVVPSKTPDPLPRSVMESMARGIPVFGYPAGGIFEMIEDERTGFLVDDAPSFIKATTCVISNSEDLETMIKHAKEKIEKEFTIEGLHDTLNALYSNL